MARRQIKSPEKNFSDDTVKTLAYLKEHRERGFSVQDLMQELNFIHKTAYRKLDILWRKGYLHKYPGFGNKYYYKFKTDKEHEATPPQVFRKGKSSNKPDGKRTAPTGNRTPPLQPGALDSLMESWAKSKWTPKIFNSAPNLPRVLARVYELAVESAYGSPPNKTELDEQRVHLNEFRTDLETALTLVKRILNQSEIWDPKVSPQFILANSHEIEEYQKLIQGVKELN